MAEGIVRRHSRNCPSRRGKRCRCGAGYEAWVYLDREKRKVRKVFKKRAEAKAWRREALVVAAKGGLRPASTDRRTLHEALVEFVAGMEKGTVRPKRRERYKPNTVRSYERVVRVYLRGSELGNLRPAEVRRSDVQDYADELLARLAPGTTSNALNPLQAYYARAISREEVTFNPTEGVDVPEKKPTRPRRIVAPTEATRLLALLPDAERAVWATAFYAGLRRGELQALRCMDIDLSADLIHVRKGWDQVEGEIEPKSESSKRTIPLLAILRDLLEAQIRATGRSGEDRVFGRSAREVFYPSTVDKRAKRAWMKRNAAEREAAREADREPELLTLLTMHECRHTFASVLIDAGANPKVIQEVMGHSKIQTTFDVYGHLLPGSFDEVRQRMDRYLAASVAA
jgi:integrase